MPSLMADFITSLDGYGAAEGWPGFWGMEGPEYLGWLEEREEHTALMGATTYRLMSGFAAEMSNLHTPEESSFAELTAMPKVVFSSTLQTPLSWANTELVDGDAVEAVRAMKRDGTRPLRTLGSLTLCRSLLAAGVVDRFRVVVFRSSPGSPAGIGSTTLTPTSHSNWSPTERSTAASSCSSTCPPCSTDHRAPTQPTD